MVAQSLRDDRQCNAYVLAATAGPSVRTSMRLVPRATARPASSGVCCGAALTRPVRPGRHVEAPGRARSAGRDGGRTSSRAVEFLPAAVSSVQGQGIPKVSLAAA